jgi:hypothetical protein
MLDRQGDLYANTSEADAYLDSGNPTYVGGLWRWQMYASQRHAGPTPTWTRVDGDWGRISSRCLGVRLSQWPTPSSL